MSWHRDCKEIILISFNILFSSSDCLDLRGHLIAETSQTGTMLAEYIYLGDQLLAMIRPGDVAYYCHNDHLGTPQILTDASQHVAWKASYKPYGEAVISIETVENPFRFPGQYYDQETGLHYNWNRYYDPKTGRYLTPDPIGLKGGINLFPYVTNNPLKSSDSKGLQVDPITGEPDWPPGVPTPKDYWDYFIRQIPCIQCDYPALINCVPEIIGDPGTGMDCLQCWQCIKNFCRPFTPFCLFCAAPCFNCAVQAPPATYQCIKKHCRIGHLDPCGGCAGD